MTNQERFDELKEKMKVVKYFGLSVEEKSEYQNLKKELGIAEKEELPDEPVVVKSSEEDRIARLEKMVESLSAENSNLRSETAKMQEGWSEYKAPAAGNKYATVKIFRKDADSPSGVIVKAVVFKDNELDEQTRRYDKLIYNITLRYDNGKEEVVKMAAEDLAKIREIEKVEIVKEDRRTLRKVEDYAIIPEKDKEGFPKRMLDGGSGYGQNIGKHQVPLEVFMVKSTCTVKRKNGQEFQIENDFLNL